MQQVGGGVDGFIWRTDDASVVKVFRRERPFLAELAVYQRIAERGLTKLRGFAIPKLLDIDRENFVLVMTHVDPPYIIDFGAAGLDERPADFQLEFEDWNAEKERLYGSID